MELDQRLEERYFVCHIRGSFMTDGGSGSGGRAVSPLLKCVCRGKRVFLVVKQIKLLGDQMKVTPSVWLYMPVPKCEFPSNPRLGNLIDLSQILPVTSSLTMSTIMPEGGVAC